MWVFAMAMAGCASKKADPKVVEAIFGNPATNMPPQGTSIVISGAVKNPVIPFYDGLTLTRALNAADYYGGPQLAQIAIIRTGQKPIYMNPKQLQTQDMLLEPGDRIELH
jgi:hypothetical protein